MNGVFNNIEEVKDYLDKLVQEELRYQTDYITHEGWTVIEEIAPQKALEYITHKGNDISEFDKESVQAVYTDMLNEYAPIYGLRELEMED
jgi:hypothetical protein